MNTLVCISKVPDTTSKIAFTDNNSKFSTDGVQFIMNPTDEWYALVRAVELKEQAGGTVTVVNVGGAENDQIIRKALAIGADTAVRIDAEPTDAYVVAAQIAAYAKDKNFDVVFTGKETIDYNGFVVGGMLSELLGAAYVSLATKMTFNGNTAEIEREIEGGEEVLDVNTPFVVSCQKGVAEQRIPNMRGIMQARSKPLEVVPGDASITALAPIVSYETPKGRGEVKMIDAENPEALIDLLRNEAKVI